MIVILLRVFKNLKIRIIFSCLWKNFLILLILISLIFYDSLSDLKTEFMIILFSALLGSGDFFISQLLPKSKFAYSVRRSTFATRHIYVKIVWTQSFASVRHSWFAIASWFWHAWLMSLEIVKSFCCFFLCFNSIFLYFFTFVILLMIANDWPSNNFALFIVFLRRSIGRWLNTDFSSARVFPWSEEVLTFFFSWSISFGFSCQRFILFTQWFLNFQFFLLKPIFFCWRIKHAWKT